MIAYNKTWLYNLFVQSEAETAYNESCITREEKECIVVKYPAAFYTPNIFIRIGLFILTIIILIFSFGLIALLFWSAAKASVSGLAIFFAIIAFAAMEYMLQRKKHYQSGVDDALLWIAAISLFCGIVLPNNFDELTTCLVGFIITLICTTRYADRLMAATCFLSFLGIVFFISMNIGGFVKAIVPFIVMAISLVTYILAKKKNDTETFNVYGQCLVIIEIVSLFTLYAAGNYWVVRELSNSMFNLHLQPGQSIPFGFVFWGFTIFIPLFYLFLGIKKKDAVLLRVGLILVAAIVFTVRYYHTVLAIEIAMLLAGSIMIVIAWTLTRYLRVPKHGFTQQELNSRNVMDNMHIESLILAETFSQQPQTTEGTKFGGGSFGGAGASGDF
ncbi:MAG: hypothetical protein ABI402_02390 [Ferruginibacter sp.]